MKGFSYADINRETIGAMAPPGRLYLPMVGCLFLGIVVGASCWAYQISQGLGVAGVRHPVVWGTYLVNFVFWVGIAHSGTLISAILFCSGRAGAPLLPGVPKP